jgi:hypothetical protein
MRSIARTTLCLLLGIGVLAAQDLSDFPPECIMLLGDKPEVFRREADQAYTTKAYELTTEQEEWFDANDNVPSRFWKAWEVVETADQLYLDHNDPHIDTEEPINSAEDANIYLKFAYGNEGLYVLFQVTDDDWNPVLSDAPSQFWKYDVCDLYLSQYSAEDMYANSGEYFHNLRYSQLGLGTAQMLVTFGGNEPVDFFYYNVAGEPTKEDPGPNNFMQSNKTTFADAEAMWGIKVELLPALEGEENVRRQEWLVPWGVIGGVPGTTRRTSGDRLGFGGGYNDFDATAIAPSRLRWRNGADPYYHCGGLQPDDTYEGRSVDSWGDILFDKKVDELLSENNVEMPEAYEPSNIRSPGFRLHSSADGVAAQRRYYTPDGRLIGATIKNQSGIALERIMRNGKMISRKRVIIP